jgi:hypothetical protein
MTIYHNTQFDEIADRLKPKHLAICLSQAICEPSELLQSRHERWLRSLTLFFSHFLLTVRNACRKLGYNEPKYACKSGLQVELFAHEFAQTLLAIYQEKQIQLGQTPSPQSCQTCQASLKYKLTFIIRRAYHMFRRLSMLTKENRLFSVFAALAW